MVWLKRVWIACLLAIAGGGPLPLWLHHWQCHCDHNHCAPSGACSTDLCSSHTARATKANCSAANGCQPHTQGSHAHAVPCGDGDADCCQVAGKSKSQTVPKVRSTGSSHDDCAACYFLSQSTIAQFHLTTPSPTAQVSLRGLTPDQIPEFDRLSAYSSRAPPVS